ncbi:MAG: SDR family oxidoreductase [Phycisphaerales bacterium]|nr:SDR family oxidoreductase [Phycisphaerales bacterium]
MNIIVTGASKGLGRAIVQSFAEKGNHQFYLTARNQQTLADAVDHLKNKYIHSTFYSSAHDLSTQAGASSFASWCSKQTTPDILINNVGTYWEGHFEKETSEQLTRMMNNNFYSAYYVTQGIVPNMIAHQSGRIFNILSIACKNPFPNASSYIISKFAFMGLSQVLRQELATHHISVTDIFPGQFDSASWDGIEKQDTQLMSPIDIAEQIVLIATRSQHIKTDEVVLSYF